MLFLYRVCKTRLNKASDDMPHNQAVQLARLCIDKADDWWHVKEMDIGFNNCDYEGSISKAITVMANDLRERKNCITSPFVVSPNWTPYLDFAIEFMHEVVPGRVGCDVKRSTLLPIEVS